MIVIFTAGAFLHTFRMHKVRAMARIAPGTSGRVSTIIVATTVVPTLATSIVVTAVVKARNNVIISPGSAMIFAVVSRLPGATVAATTALTTGATVDWTSHRAVRTGLI